MSFLGDALNTVASGGANLTGNVLGSVVGGIQDPIKGKFQTAAANPNIVNFANSPQFQQAQGGVNTQLTNQNTIQQLLNAQNGIGNQSQVYQQLQDIIAGRGPNPAQAALNQATGANVANQAALMAGQRGASANPALIARQAAQQGANIQQNAAGQAATLQAQQGLNAINQAGGIAGQQVGQQLANQQNLTGEQLANQNSILNAIGQQNSTQAGIQNVQQQGLTGVTQQNAQQAGQIAGGILGGAGAVLGKAGGFAKGGKVENPKLSAVPPHLKEIAKHYHHESFGGGEYQPQMKLAYGGDAKANVGSSLKTGGKVPGKAKVAGDSEQNDTVAAKLSPGEVVIPRSVMQSKDPVKAAAQFVAGLQKKKGSESGKHESDFKEALRRAVKERKHK
jgi:hypothetical protein